MESSGTTSFRACLSPRPDNHLLVTVLSPLLAAPLYRSYPADMGADAAVERAVAHASAIVTALLPEPVQVRGTWQAVLWGATSPAAVQSAECSECARREALTLGQHCGAHDTV